MYDGRIKEIISDRQNNIDVDESVLDVNGMVAPTKLRQISFDPINNGYLVLRERVGNAFSDGAKIE